MDRINDAYNICKSRAESMRRALVHLERLDEKRAHAKSLLHEKAVADLDVATQCAISEVQTAEKLWV
jgi:hypothetical protein